MQVHERLVEYFGFTPELHDTADSLGMDSLEQVQFIMSVEDMFGIEISDKEMENLRRVEDVVKLVERKINKMQIKIVKSTMNAYWYADMIGEVFDVADEGDRGYIVESPDFDGQRLVLKEDAEIVREDDREYIGCQRAITSSIDKLDYLHCLIAASHGDVFMYWDVKEGKIKYQILFDDDQIETDSFEDVEGVLEAMTLIRTIANKNKA